MNKEREINMSEESSAHNDINKIVLKKKTLANYDDESQNIKNDNQFYGNISNNDSPSNNTNNSFNNRETKIINQNIQSNPVNNNQTNQINYNIQKKEVKKSAPSVLIIFIILLIIFGWDVISDLINKKNEPKIPNITETINSNDDTETSNKESESDDIEDNDVEDTNNE